MSEKGEITIEAIIVVLFSMFTIMILMDFGFMAYNKFNVTKTASEAATDVANVYAHQEAEPFLGYVDLSNFYQHNLYRHFKATLFGQQETKMDRSFREKARWYACYRIQKSEYISSSSSYDDVKAELVDRGELGRLQIKVTMTRKYKVMSADIFGLFGLQTEYTCQGTGYAECVDTIDYINSLNMKKELIETYLEKLDKEFQKIVTIIENFKKMRNGG